MLSYSKKRSCFKADYRLRKPKIKFIFLRRIIFLENLDEVKCTFLSKPSNGDQKGPQSDD